MIGAFPQSKRFYGGLAIFCSMFCFNAETLVVRWASSPEVALTSQFLVFARFLLGFVLVGSVVFITRKAFRPRRTRLLLGRTFTNILSVFFFYKAVELTTVAEGSILNMTFPIFIGIFSWFLFKEQRDMPALAMTAIAFCGIFLVIGPEEFHLAWNSLWGLSSGILAAVSLILLNIARQENDTDTILLIVFGVGTLVLYFPFRAYLHVPTLEEFGYLFSAALFAVAGQYLLTVGFRYVSAVEGGILSTIRIPMAALLGPYLTADPHLSLGAWVGALLIFGTNIYFIIRKPGSPH
ncbi:MAG: EamA family transporter [bacterium]|nr:EamA family transporter [bacterium]